MSKPGPIEAGESVEVNVTVVPADAPIIVSIDHGDGTITGGVYSIHAYAAGGPYQVRAIWTTASRSDSAVCGAIKVVEPYEYEPG